MRSRRPFVGSQTRPQAGLLDGARDRKARVAGPDSCAWSRGAEKDRGCSLVETAWKVAGRVARLRVAPSLCLRELPLSLRFEPLLILALQPSTALRHRSSIDDDGGGGGGGGSGEGRRRGRSRSSQFCKTAHPSAATSSSTIATLRRPRLHLAPCPPSGREAAHLQVGLERQDLRKGRGADPLLLPPRSL